MNGRDIPSRLLCFGVKIDYRVHLQETFEIFSPFFVTFWWRNRSAKITPLDKILFTFQRNRGWQSNLSFPVLLMISVFICSSEFYM